MSDTTPQDTTTTPPREPVSTPVGTTGRPPIVRLPTWVNVVIVLTLLSTCTAANSQTHYVDQGVWSQSGNAVSEADVRDLCRLLGAVAVEQSIDLEATLGAAEADTICATAAREAVTP